MEQENLSVIITNGHFSYSIEECLSFGEISKDILAVIEKLCNNDYETILVKKYTNIHLTVY